MKWFEDTSSGMIFNLSYIYRISKKDLGKNHKDPYLIIFYFNESDINNHILEYSTSGERDNVYKIIRDFLNNDKTYWNI